MSTGAADRRTERVVELARLVRQRAELGAPPLVLSSLDRQQLGTLLESMVSAPVSPPPPVELSAPPSDVSPAPERAKPAPPLSEASRPTEASKTEGTKTEATKPRLPVVDFDTSGLDYDALRDGALSCTRCALASTRTQGVFSDGNPEARVMVVGEAPGANEDESGVPFVGAAGRLLDLMLASVGLSRRESVYICNVIKCRPPGNRNPEPSEIAQCAPWLHRQIELVAPEVILAVGTFAGQLLSGYGDRTLGALRGEVHTYRGVPLVVTYHPAALLRNGSWTQSSWDDLQLLRNVLDGA